MTPRSLLAPARLAGPHVLRTQTDDRLLDLARAGSDRAFEAIVERYRRPLLNHCRRLLAEEGAEDAVQQTFVKAHAAMGGTKGELRLRPWLYRIAHNTALNALRDRSLRHEPLDDRFMSASRPEGTAEDRQEFRDVLSAVKALPGRQRDAIVLRELEGRSYDEIAGELGVTSAAVRQLLNRARNTVRAGVSALTPVGLLSRLAVPTGDGPVAMRVAEICGAGGAGAAAAKVCVTAAVTSAVVGGVAVAPRDHHRNARHHTAAAATSAPAAASASRQAAAVERNVAGGQQRNVSRNQRAAAHRHAPTSHRRHELGPRRDGGFHHERREGRPPIGDHHHDGGPARRPPEGPGADPGGGYRPRSFDGSRDAQQPPPPDAGPGPRPGGELRSDGPTPGGAGPLPPPR